jgi:hypothetical protein
VLVRTVFNDSSPLEEACMRQHRTRRFEMALFAGLLTLTSGALLAQDVKYNYAMGTNFTKYKTYKWVDLPNQNYPDQITDQTMNPSDNPEKNQKNLQKAVTKLLKNFPPSAK